MVKAQSPRCPDFRREGFQFSRGTAANGQFGPRLKTLQGDGATNAAAGTSDDNDFIFESKTR
jgi:hypothetical protein